MADFRLAGGFRSPDGNARHGAAERGYRADMRSHRLMRKLFALGVGGMAVGGLALLAAALRWKEVTRMRGELDPS